MKRDWDKILETSAWIMMSPFIVLGLWFSFNVFLDVLNEFAKHNVWKQSIWE